MLPEARQDGGYRGPGLRVDDRAPGRVGNGRAPGANHLVAAD